MELNYLNDFVTLARIRHFQNAADALFISQSTLSKHIKAIESELGQDLFIRSRKCSQLTEFGKLFLPYAKKSWRSNRNIPLCFCRALRQMLMSPSAVFPWSRCIILCGFSPCS